MRSRSVIILTLVAGVMAIGELGSSIIIAVENYRDSMPLGAVLFAGFFLVAAWLLRRGRVTSGTVFLGLLCLFEVVAFPGWQRHNALDWAYQTIFGAVALAGLAAAIVVLGSRRRSAEITAS
jgi:hypothetical protein